ncbi:MAG: hypothetical protein SFT94_04345 [Pseudanabaenaceae cyanobacterium bins.68]|nr:hypothetical protein [Pseudanabaenaceae cyanobacterium bins.68]
MGFKLVWLFSLAIAIALLGNWIWQTQFSPSIQPLPPRQGSLRFGNLTQHPVRIVLKSQNQPEPWHWDFTPGEGGEKGLVLSLPDQVPQITNGDQIFVFAIDGSRQYWGPITVGESEITWRSDRQEWEFTLSFKAQTYLSPSLPSRPVLAPPTIAPIAAILSQKLARSPL